VQTADEVTQFCHVLHADDIMPDGGSSLTDQPQDVSPSKTTTALRVNKVLAELMFTEQQYVKVKLLFICEAEKITEPFNDRPVT